MEQVAILQAVVTADIVDFETQMNKVKSSAQNTSGFLAGLGDFGQTLTMGLTLPLVGAGIAIAKVGSDFDAEMRNINSLLQLSEENFVSFGEQVNKFGTDSTYGANKTADALYTIVSAGIGIKDTADAMTLLGASMKVAESGRDDLDRTTMAMIAMHETFLDVANGMDDERIGDVIANMVQMGAGPLSSYTQNMAKVGPAADMLGVSFEELGSNISQLSLIYGNGSKPMTAMGMLMSNLIKPNLTLQEGLHNLGVVGFKDLMVKAGGFNEALFMLQGTMSEFDFNKSFSKTGFEAVAILTNDIDGTREAYQKFMSTVDGAAERAWEEQMKSFDATFSRAKAAVEGVAVALSNTLLPIITPVFEQVSVMGQAFINADPAMQRMVVVAGLLAAAIGPVLVIVGSLASLFSPLGILIGGAAAAAGMAAGNFNGMGDKLNDLIAIAVDAARPLAEVIDSLITLANLKFDPPGSDDQTPTDWGRVMGNTTIPDPARYVKVEKPTSVWEIYKTQGYDKLFSWEDFKEEMMEGGWKGGNIAIKPGDVITFGDPGDIEDVALEGANTALDVIKGSFSSVFTAGTTGGARAGWFGSPEGMWNESVMDHIHNARAAEGRLKNALAQLWTNVAATIPGLLQGVAVAIGGAAGYLGNAFVDLFKSVWAWLNSGGPSEGASSVMSFIQTNIIDPFTTAFGIAWPDLQADLEGLWTEISGWFDSKVGAGLDFLGNLFSGTEANGGNTNVYEAVKALLNGDIFKAIDEIIPGAGTHLQNLIGGDWGGKIGGAFPKIAEGLATLAASFGEWFRNDAIPTVARSVGYFAGKVGVLIGQAFGAIGGFLSGSGEGIDGGDAVAGIRDTMNIVGEGFQEALTEGGVGLKTEGSAFSNWADQIVTGIAGALGVAALTAGLFAAFSGGIWAGIGAALSVPLWFGAKLLGVGKVIATTLMNSLGVATTWAGLMGQIGAGMAAAIAAAPLLTLAIGALAVTAAVTAIWLQIPQEVRDQVTNTVRGFFDSIFGEGTGVAMGRGLEMAMYQAALNAARLSGNDAGVAYFENLLASMNGQQDRVEGAAKASGERIGKATIMGLTDNWDSMVALPNPVTITDAGVVVDPAIMEMWDKEFANVIQSASWWNATEAQRAELTKIMNMVAAEPLKAEFMWDFVINKGMDSTDQAAFEQQVDTFLQGFTPEQLKDMKVVYDGIGFSLVPDTIDVDTSGASVNVTGNAPNGWWNNVAPTTWGNFGVSPMEVGPHLPDGSFTGQVTASSFIAPDTPATVKQLGDDTILAIQDTTAKFGETVAGMVADGTLDPEVVNENFLIPLGTYWEGAFGASGSLTMASTGFATTFVGAMGDVDAALLNTVTTSSEQLTLLLDGLTMKKDEISGVLNTLGENTTTALGTFATTFQTIMTQVGTYVTTTAAKIHGLITEINTLSSITAGGGGQPIDGSHAGGLDSVPYDGYVAELHKGEMVLTAEQASNYKMPQQAVTSNKTSNSNNTNNAVVVNVYGGDTDKILGELRRRGVKIGS